MVKKVVTVLFILMVGVFSLFSQASEKKTEKFIPQLKVGDWWELKVERLDVFNNVWQPPYFLKYLVISSEKGVYNIEVTDEKSGNIVGYLKIRAKDFRVLEASYYRRLAGKDILEKEVYPDTKTPIISEAGYLPNYFPVFPLIKKKVLLDGMEEAVAVPQKKQYKSTEKRGIFSFSRVYSQKSVDSVVLTKLDATEESAPEIVKEVKKEDLKDGYYVTLSDSLLRIRIEQLWKEGFPFYLYSKSNNMKVILTKWGETSEKGGKK